MQIDRRLEPNILEWLKERMVFIGGPRQVGKTYLSKRFLSSKKAYFSWDNLKDREFIKKHELPLFEKTIALDEIHKYPRWRMLMKGLFDKNSSDHQFIVTGSTRLDHFRKGGDSLFGRYHYFRLHPFTVSEVDSNFSQEAVNLLLKFGGFPEPFLKQRESFTKIWQRERLARVIQQDLRDLTQLKDYNQLELLSDLLPERVGSLLSYNSIAEDLEKSPHTITNWIRLLSDIYQCFLIAPYGPNKVKAIKKQNKLYLWDWSVIANPGARFENLVASHLLKYCHFIEDTEGDRMELRFLRDQFGHEVDFIVLKNKKPDFLVECKTGESQVSRNIRFYQNKIKNIECYQVHLGQKSFQTDNVRVLPFYEFAKLKGL